jgi:hypothetical protein
MPASPIRVFPATITVVPCPPGDVAPDIVPGPNNY